MSANETTNAVQAIAWVQLSGELGLLADDAIGLRAHCGFRQRVITSEAPDSFGLFILLLERTHTRAESAVLVAPVGTTGPSRDTYPEVADPVTGQLQNPVRAPAIQPIMLEWLGADLASPAWLPFGSDPLPSAARSGMFDAIAVLQPATDEGATLAGDFAVLVYRIPSAATEAAQVERVIPPPAPPPPPVPEAHRWFAPDGEYTDSVLLEVTATPSVFSAGDWPRQEIEQGIWRLRFTPGFASTDPQLPGTYATLICPDDNGIGQISVNGVGLSGPWDRLWVWSDDGNQAASVPLVFAAGDELEIQVDQVNDTITVRGAAGGDGTYPCTVNWSGNGALNVGQESAGVAVWVGSIGDFLVARAEVVPDSGAGPNPAPFFEPPTIGFHPYLTPLSVPGLQQRLALFCLSEEWVGNFGFTESGPNDVALATFAARGAGDEFLLAAYVFGEDEEDSSELGLGYNHPAFPGEWAVFYYDSSASPQAQFVVLGDASFAAMAVSLDVATGAYVLVYSLDGAPSTTLVGAFTAGLSRPIQAGSMGGNGGGLGVGRGWVCESRYLTTSTPLGAGELASIVDGMRAAWELP